MNMMYQKTATEGHLLKKFLIILCQGKGLNCKTGKAVWAMQINSHPLLLHLAGLRECVS